MNILVTKNNVQIDNREEVHKGEYNVNKLYFSFTDDYNGLSKMVVFSNMFHSYELAITNNECNIPPQILTDRGCFTLGVYAYTIVDEQIVKRYSPTPIELVIENGSYITALNPAMTEPTLFQTFAQQVEEQFDEMSGEIADNTEEINDLKDRATALEEGKQDKLTAGSHITINNNVISSDGEPNVITKIQKNGTDLPINNKTVNVPVPTKTSDITNDSGFINKEVNNLTNYLLKVNTGATLEATINNTTYVMTLKLKNSSGTALSTQTIDLPLETMVIDASYDSATKEIVLYLKNGNTVRFSVADLISGLQEEITPSNKLSSDLVDDTNKTNKFVTQEEKTKLAGIEAGAEVNIIEEVKVNNEALPVENKSINIDLTPLEAEIEALQQENEELLDQIPTGTAEGASIHVEDSSNLSFKEVELLGNASQLQTTGKNLADISSTNIELGYYNATTGEATSSNYRIRTIGYVSCLASTDYILSAKEQIVTINIYQYDANKEFIKADTANYSTNLTITTEANTAYIRWSINYINSSISSAYLYILENMELQLEQGSTATAYEPYSSEKASPSPDYAQPIKVVTGDNFIKIKGKNIFNINDTPIIPTETGTSYTVTENTIEIVNSSSGVNKGLGFNIFVGKGKTITISYSKLTTNIESANTALRYYFSKKPMDTFNLGLGEAVDTTIKTATIEATDDYLMLFVRIGNSITASIENIRVEYSDTQTDYEPYTEKTQLISLGVKNLFDVSNVTYDNGHFRNDSGVVTNSSSGTGYTTSYTEVKPNTTYTISGEISPNGVFGKVYFLDSNKDWISRTASFKTEYTFTTPENCYYIQIQYVVAYVDFSTIQLEEGSIAHSYSPYGQEPIELCKIGNYKDRIYKADGKWWLEKQVVKKTLDGSETWTNTTLSNGSKCYSVAKSLFSFFGGNNNGNMLCQHFKSKSITDVYLGDFSAGSTYINFCKDNDENPENFKIWLSTHNLFIYYGRSSSRTTEITNETLVGQLEEWLKMKTNKNITNSYAVTENEQPTLKEVYYLDLETLFSNVNNAILSLGNNT